MMSDLLLPAVVLLEAGLVGGLAAVALRLARMGVNGPCRVCLATLFTWRVAVVANMPCASPCWDYLLGALFGYAFLYATLHLGALMHRMATPVSAIRGRQVRCVGMRRKGAA